MREIKFRGERVDGQGWITGFLYQSELHSWITDSRNINLETHRNIAWFQVIPETVGQYTGLKDSSQDNKEIYEGDIIQGGLFKNGVVTFENGTFTLWGQPLGWDVEDYDEKPEVLLPEYWADVIGNIYENKDLLK